MLSSATKAIIRVVITLVLTVSLIGGCAIASGVFLIFALDGGATGSAAQSPGCNPTATDFQVPGGATVTGKLPKAVPEPYNGIITAAAAVKGADPYLLATLFWKEHGRSYPAPPPPYGHGHPWAKSYASAEGPMQFIPPTWAIYGLDANHDGVADPNDLIDAINSAAVYTVAIGGKAGTPLGDVGHPYQKGTVVNVMATYNGGPTGDFSRNNGQTWSYYHDGAQYYASLTNGTAPLASGGGSPTCTETPAATPGAGLQKPPNIGGPGIDGYYTMPPSLNGALHINSCQAHRTGSLEQISVLYTVAERWKSVHPKGWINLGDMNAAGHLSHKWGVAADIEATTNGIDKVADFIHGNYNQAATIELGEMFVDTGKLKSIWFNDEVVDHAVTAYARSKNLPLEQMMPQLHHDDHFHTNTNGPRGPLYEPHC